MKLREFLKKARDTNDLLEFKTRYSGTDNHMVVFRRKETGETTWLFGGWIDDDGTVSSLSIKMWLKQWFGEDK